MTTSTTPQSASPAKKKSGIGRWILRICIAIVAIVIVALVILYFSIDGIIRKDVAAAASNSTGQTATLDGASLQLSGHLTLTGLNIHNPDNQGFKSADFLSVPSIAITVKPSSLLSDTVEIPDITIEGLSLSLEQNGLKNNLGDILAYTNKQSADAPAKTGSGEPGKSKQLSIGKLTLNNVTVTASGFGASQTLHLTPIIMTEPTNPDGRPVKIADLTAKILSEIAKQVAANPQLPDALKKNLGNLNNLAPALQDTLKNPAGAATQLNNLGNLLKTK